MCRRIVGFGFAALLFSTTLTVAQQKSREYGKPLPPAEMAAYLKRISDKGKERGYKEVVYKQAPEGELRIFFHLPKDWSPTDRRPAIVFFYGGSWSSGNVFSYDEQSEYFAKCGVVAGMVDYRVRTRHGTKPDKSVEDGRSAVRWIRANCKTLGVDPDRIMAGGGSAGAHVAACTAYAAAPTSDTDDLKVSCTPNGLMLCFPPVGFLDGDRSAAAEQLLGKELADRISPVRHVAKGWPPTVFFYGNTDRLLPGGITMHNKVREAGSPTELYLAEGQGHGFVNMAPWHYVSSKTAVDFFMRNGVIDKKPLPDVPPGELKKYNGEPVEKVYVKTAGNPSREQLNKSREAPKPPAKEPKPPPFVGTWELKADDERSGRLTLRADGTLTASSASGDSELPDYNGRWYVVEEKGNRIKFEFGHERNDPNAYKVTIELDNSNAFTLIETVKGGVPIRDKQRFVRVLADKP
jgi:acetyl esterase